MTKDEFMEELGDLGYKWFGGVTDYYPRILTVVGDRQFCPITAVCYSKIGQVYGSHHFLLAADELALDTELASRIAEAADNPNRANPQTARALEINDLRDEMQEVLSIPKPKTLFDRIVRPVI